MVNNDNPGFLPDGTVDTAGIAKGGSVPPTNVRTIGEALNDKNISWAYYGGAYNAAVALEQDPTSTNPAVQIGRAYCNICNFESYANAIMGMRRNARLISRTRRTSSRLSATARCPPYRS